MNFPLFIARRLYSERGENNKVSKPALYIATTGVALGLAVMIISVCVILGFKHTIRDKVTGLGAHATVANFVSLHGSEQRPIDYSDSIRNVLKKTPGLKSMQSFAMTQGILKTDSDFMGVAYKGIAADYDTAFIHSCMTEGSIPRFSDKSSGNKILISKNIATKLRLKTGDRVFSYFINNGDIRVRRYTVAGIYQTNMTKFDESLCFCDLYSAVKLNGWSQGQVSGVELQLHDIANVPIAARYLVKNVNRQGDKYGETYSSETVYEMYPQIFSWLDLLDLNVWIILGLMICVSGITIISGHHTRAHTHDRHPESYGMQKQVGEKHLHLVCSPRHRARTHSGRHHRSGTRGAAEIHQIREPRRISLLRGLRARGNQRAIDPAHKRGNPGNMPPRVHRT